MNLHRRVQDRQLIGPSEMPTKIVYLPDNEINACKTMKQAIRLSYDLSNKEPTRRAFAENVYKVAPSTFSEWLSEKTKTNGYKPNFPTEEIKDLPDVTGNYALVQFLCSRYDIPIGKGDDEAQKLRDEVKQLKAEKKELEAVLQIYLSKSA